LTGTISDKRLSQKGEDGALLDTFSRRIIGLAMSVFRDGALVMAALRMALAQRVLVGELIHHTDRGVNTPPSMCSGGWKKVVLMV
jgi:transposase InsO family protein